MVIIIPVGIMVMMIGTTIMVTIIIAQIGALLSLVHSCRCSFSRQETQLQGGLRFWCVRVRGRRGIVCCRRCA
jgi:hypothetical protein